MRIVFETLQYWEKKAMGERIPDPLLFQLATPGEPRH
jgi:hypothetical protein